MTEKARCDTGFILNLSSCECKCDKSCGIGQYLDYKNCKYIYIYGEYMMNKWDLNDLNDLKVDYYKNFYQYKNRL